MATMLTKDFQKVGTIYLALGEIRIYAKYTSQNKENNYTFITVDARYYVYSGSVSFDNWSAQIKVGSSAPISASSGFTTVYAGETIMMRIAGSINHNDDGTAIPTNIYVNFTASYGGSGSQTVQVSAPTIERYPMILTASDFTDEENPTITYSTIMGFENATLYGCISTDGTTDTVSYRQLNVEDGQYTFELTTAERNSLRSATPNSTTLPVTFILKTTVDNTNYYSDMQKNMTITNATPMFLFTSQEQNAKVVSMVGSNSGSTLIANVSQLKFTYTPTTYKYATVKNFTVSEGTTGHILQSYVLTSSPYEQTFNVSSGAYAGKFIHVLTDSRNLSRTTQDTQRTLLEYDIVRINSYSFKRQNSTSSNVIFNGEFYYWGNVGSYTNTPSVKYKLDDGNWTTIPSSNYVIDTTNHKLTITNYTISNILPYTSQGQFSILIEDALTSKTDISDNGKVLKGVPTFDYGEHDLKVNGDLYIADTDGDNAVNVKSQLNNKMNTYNIITDGQAVKMPYKIDGKDVYAQRFSATKGAGTSVTINTGISNFTKMWIDAGQSYVISNNIYLGLYQYGSSTDFIRAYQLGGTITVLFGSTYSSINCNVIVTVLYQVL